MLLFVQLIRIRYVSKVYHFPTEVNSLFNSQMFKCSLVRGRDSWNFPCSFDAPPPQACISILNIKNKNILTFDSIVQILKLDADTIVRKHKRSSPLEKGFFYCLYHILFNQSQIFDLILTLKFSL